MMRLPKPRKSDINAGLFKRVFAFALDLVIVNLVVGYPFGKLISRLVPASDVGAVYNYLAGSPGIAGQVQVAILLAFLMALAYFVTFEYKMQQTPGKLFMNLRVVSKKRLRFWQCLLRSLWILPFFPFVLFWVLDPIVALFSKERQRLTEKWSRTKVVESFYY